MGLSDWMAPERRQERANSFGAIAELYDLVRPTYPAEAVSWALAPLGSAEPGSLRIADIGAGTGIMTRRLAGLGYRIVAIEPDALMRQRLQDTTPSVEAVAGSAEALPLADASIDGAVAAQAYHWFDRGRAHPELARVIRPGGVFAAIWNDRDEDTPWVREYTHIIEGDRAPDGSAADSGRAQNPSYGDAFGPVQLREFRHSVHHTTETLVALLKSRSYFITATADRQVALEAEVRQLAASHPSLAGRTEFDLPYVTLVFRATRI